MNEFTEKINDVRQNVDELRKNISLYSIQLNTLETIWDSIPALLFFKDTRNNVVRVNDYFCKIMGCKKQDVEGVNINKLMSDHEQAARYASNDIQVIKTGVAKLGISERLFDTGIQLRTDKFPVIVDDKVKGVLGFSVIINEK